MKLDMRQFEKGEKQEVTLDGKTLLEIYRNGLIVHIYKPKASKAYARYYFKTAAEMETYIAKEIIRAKAHKTFMQERRNDRAAYTHDFKVGDLLHGSWGWEQTNCEFAEVIAVPSNKSITIKRINGKQDSSRDSGNSMANYLLPVRGSYVGLEETHRVSKGGYIKMGHAQMSKTTETEAHYNSWYA